MCSQVELIVFPSFGIAVSLERAKWVFIQLVKTSQFEVEIITLIPFDSYV